MMKSAILAVILVVTLTLVSGSPPSQLNYQINQEFAFNLNSLVDGRGRDVTTDGRTSGSYATMASTVVIQCTDEDADSYLFVMNMFGTEVNVGQGADTQSSTFATTTSYPSTQDLKKAWDSHRSQVGDDNALGDDMYFQLNKTGEIVQVWYQDGDSPYFVSVKLGAINAFATRVVQPGQTEKIMVSDPVGTHFATVMGLNPATNPGVVVNKTFNQEDVTAFPDPNLRPGNVRMAALTTTGIHEEGYIISSTVHQTVDLVNARQNPGTSVFPDHLLTADDDAQKRDGSDTLGFDMNLSSKGTLAIALASMANAPTNSYFKNAVHTTETLQSSNYVRSSLFDLSVMATQFVNSITRGDFNVDAAMTTLFADPRETLMQSEQLKLMDKFADFLRKNPDAHQRQVLQKILSGESRHRFGANAYAVIRERILYVFVKAQDTHSLVNYGLSSSNVETSLRTLFTIGAGLHNVDEYLVVALRRMISSPDDETRRAALLTMGAVLARVQDAAIRQPIVWALTEHLQVLLQPSYASTVEDLTAVIDALGNAGPAAVSFDVISNADLITHSVASVRLAAVRAMRKFVSRQHTENLNSDVTRQQAASVLQRLLVNDNDYHVRRAALKLLQQRFPHLDSLMLAGEVDNSDFPFNKSYTTGFTVGGHVANATFFGELFAGTNLDCHQQYFNYEGLAEATVTLALFDWSKEAVDAEIVYGRDNGAPLADRIYLRVWDDVLYDKQIPTISCDEHTYPITSASPGFSVSYTVWVSVIPITFTASATLNLNLAWGWQICDSTLSAMVELIPGATLSIAGDVEVNVLIIRAGLELEGAFNTQIRPQASILGDLCEIQFDVRQESTPMTADFNAYYEWNHCKFWIFDCHWGKHNEDVLWSWTEPAVDKILYQIDWPIKL